MLSGSDARSGRKKTSVPSRPGKTTSVVGFETCMSSPTIDALTSGSSTVVARSSITAWRPTETAMTHMTGIRMHPGAQAGARPVDIEVAPALTERNRLTTAFRPILAIPHVLLVGGPAAFAATIVGTLVTQLGVSTGVLGS